MPLSFGCSSMTTPPCHDSYCNFAYRSTTMEFFRLIRSLKSSRRKDFPSKVMYSLHHSGQTWIRRHREEMCVMEVHLMNRCSTERKMKSQQHFSITRDLNQKHCSLLPGLRLDITGTIHVWYVKHMY